MDELEAVSEEDPTVNHDCSEIAGYARAMWLWALSFPGEFI